MHGFNMIPLSHIPASLLRKIIEDGTAPLYETPNRPLPTPKFRQSHYETLTASELNEFIRANGAAPPNTPESGPSTPKDKRVILQSNVDEGDAADLSPNCSPHESGEDDSTYYSRYDGPDNEEIDNDDSKDMDYTPTPPPRSELRNSSHSAGKAQRGRAIYKSSSGGYREETPSPPPNKRSAHHPSPISSSKKDGDTNPELASNGHCASPDLHMRGGASSSCGDGPPWYQKYVDAEPGHDFEIQYVDETVPKDRNRTLRIRCEGCGMGYIIEENPYTEDLSPCPPGLGNFCNSYIDHRLPMAKAHGESSVSHEFVEYPLAGSSGSGPPITWVCGYCTECKVFYLVSGIPSEYRSDEDESDEEDEDDDEEDEEEDQGSDEYSDSSFRSDSDSDGSESGSEPAASRPSTPELNMRGGANGHGIACDNPVLSDEGVICEDVEYAFPDAWGMLHGSSSIGPCTLEAEQRMLLGHCDNCKIEFRVKEQNGVDEVDSNASRDIDYELEIVKRWAMLHGKNSITHCNTATRTLKGQCEKCNVSFNIHEWEFEENEQESNEDDSTLSSSSEDNPEMLPIAPSPPRNAPVPDGVARTQELFSDSPSPVRSRSTSPHSGSVRDTTICDFGLGGYVDDPAAGADKWARWHYGYDGAADTPPRGRQLSHPTPNTSSLVPRPQPSHWGYYFNPPQGERSVVAHPRNSHLNLDNERSKSRSPTPEVHMRGGALKMAKKAKKSLGEAAYKPPRPVKREEVNRSALDVRTRAEYSKATKQIAFWVNQEMSKAEEKCPDPSERMRRELYDYARGPHPALTVPQVAQFIDGDQHVTEDFPRVFPYVKMVDRDDKPIVKGNTKTVKSASWTLGFTEGETEKIFQMLGRDLLERRDSVLNATKWYKPVTALSTLQSGATGSEQIYPYLNIYRHEKGFLVGLSMLKQFPVIEAVYFFRCDTSHPEREARFNNELAANVKSLLEYFNRTRRVLSHGRTYDFDEYLPLDAQKGRDWISSTLELLKNFCLENWERLELSSEEDSSEHSSDDSSSDGDSASDDGSSLALPAPPQKTVTDPGKQVKIKPAPITKQMPVNTGPKKDIERKEQIAKPETKPIRRKNQN